MLLIDRMYNNAYSSNTRFGAAAYVGFSDSEGAAVLQRLLTWKVMSEPRVRCR